MVGSRLLLLAAACYLLAVTLSTMASGLKFPAYLLTLVAGVLCGWAFVGATFAMKNQRLGALVHLGGAILFGGALAWAVQSNFQVPESLPELPRAALVLAQVGAAPGIAWIVIAVIWRLSDFARRPSAKSVAQPLPQSQAQPLPVAPQWSDRLGGDFVEFSAIPLRLRTLAWLIVGIIVVLGSVFGAALIGADWLLQIESSPGMIVAAGLVIALPAYLVFSAALRRRTLPCAVQFGEGEARVTAGGAQFGFAYSDLTELVWRCETDYARVEMRGGEKDISLMVGVARAPHGVRACLPELTPLTRRRLAAAGLELQSSQRDGPMCFARPADAGARDQRVIGTSD